MNTYHRVLVKDTELFAVENFPNLQTSLQQVTEKIKLDPSPETVDMLLSFLIDYKVNGKLVSDYPEQAEKITSRLLPIAQLEDIFEASKHNPIFRKELEDYVRSSLLVGVAKQNLHVHY